MCVFIYMHVIVVFFFVQSACLCIFSPAVPCLNLCVLTVLLLMCLFTSEILRWVLYTCHIHAQEGNTALILAAERGHIDCVQLLLDAGADKHAMNHVRV